MENNTLYIKLIEVTISTFETLPFFDLPDFACPRWSSMRHLSPGPLAASCPTSRRRHANRLESSVRSTGSGLETFKVGAGVGAGQIQYLAPEFPVFLDLRFRLRRASGELAVLPAGLGDGAHDLLEARMI